jgi:geranylgeranyl diphosphate synthase type II
LSIQSYLKTRKKKIDHALEAYLPKEAKRSSVLCQAMRYGVLGEAKRIRPILALAACEAVGGKDTQTLPAACAIELIHSYSLIHDDLPCMDDDDLRRGKPSCHKKFGEAAAVLAADALLTLAFQILARSGQKKPSSSKEKTLEVISLIAESAGVFGMVGGQAMDMEFAGKTPDLPALESIHIHKTGALIAASVKAGAILGGGTAAQTKSLYEYGKNIGFLFQMVDDLLDGEGYVRVLGAPNTKEEARRLSDKSKKALRGFGKKAVVLEQLADFILERKA